MEAKSIKLFSVNTSRYIDGYILRTERVRDARYQFLRGFVRKRGYKNLLRRYVQFFYQIYGALNQRVGFTRARAGGYEYRPRRRAYRPALAFVGVTEVKHAGSLHFIFISIYINYIYRFDAV